MFSYYLRLAWLSFKSTPVMSLLMVLAIAVGVGVAMSTLTLQHVMASNALADKNSQLYYVQLNSHPLGDHYPSKARNGLPDQIAYKDAEALLQSNIPTYQVAMHQWGGTIESPNPDIHPMMVNIRVTTRDFFPLFNVSFIYGNGWDKSADSQAQYQVVLGKKMNEDLFGGQNSVGKTVQINGHPYQVVGVVKDFKPVPSVEDLSTGSFGGNSDIYLPFGLHRPLEMMPYGQMSCFSNSDAGSPEGYEGLLQSNCIWLQYWVQLDSAEQKARYTQFLNNYYQDQKQQGRFQRDNGVVLSTPSQWLYQNNVVGNDTRLLTWLAFAFLLVCIINTIALLMAKLLRKAPEAGVRRALGASRGAVFTQHLVESLLVGGIGGLLGIVLALLSLGAIRHLVVHSMASIVHMDLLMAVVTVGLAMLASLLAGVYPAWRISTTNPAHYLKTQ
ncbi:ABC transporter permease [Gallaecimonas mangrovi]|uniref:ABC transporter permease n=1 Tax=Gallaecimonas mangrovi TaxID=2291597 RepID=UPI000E1FE908|nr:ABC transporter permease [Gallaecimonas mangrovi]